MGRETETIDDVFKRFWREKKQRLFLASLPFHLSQPLEVYGFSLVKNEPSFQRYMGLMSLIKRKSGNIIYFGLSSGL
jgi:hypothetical protein